jgi:hypothetical protein
MTCKRSRNLLALKKRLRKIEYQSEAFEVGKRVLHNLEQPTFASISLNDTRMTQERSVRDAIVLSGWTWEAFNVPERIALTLAHAGARVLYCENPVSLIRKARSLIEVSQGVFAFRPKFLSHRLNKFYLLSKVQAQFVAQQVCAHASNLKLRDPVLVYPHGDYCLALCRELKRRRVPLMHVCMDDEPTLQMGPAQESDMTFAIPRASFDELKARFGEKVRLLPQFSSLENPGDFIQNSDSEAPEGAGTKPSTARLRE